LYGLRLVTERTFLLKEKQHGCLSLLQECGGYNGEEMVQVVGWTFYGNINETYPQNRECVRFSTGKFYV